MPFKFREFSYEAFPGFSGATPGAVEIDVTGNELGVAYDADIVYAHRDGLDLKVQFLHPYTLLPQNRLWPIVVFVQGSAWLKQNLYCNVVQLGKFCLRGYAAFIVEYRPSTTRPFPAQLIDAKTAIRFARKFAREHPEYCLDAERVIVWGDSSGGHTALLAGLTDGIAELDDPLYGEYSAAVSGVVDYYGVVDITRPDFSSPEQGSPDSPEGLLIGGKWVRDNPELAAPTIVTNYVSPARAIPPVFVAHGTKDWLVGFAQSLLLSEALRRADKKHVFYRLNGATHGGAFFWEPRLLDAVDAFCRDCLADQ